MRRLDDGIGGEVSEGLLPVELVNRLIGQLSEEYGMVAKLLHETERKREALVADDLGTLETIVSQEAALAQEFEQLEAGRLKLMTEIARHLVAMDFRQELGADITLAEVVPHTPDSRRQHLRDQGMKLKDAMLDLQEANSLNAELLRHSMVLANYCLSLITGDAGQTIYGQPGKKERPGYQQGSLDARV